MGTKFQDLAAPSNELGLSVAICRLCMGKGCINMAPIFNIELEVCIADKIARVTQLNVYLGDGLPAMVCRRCVLQLNAAYVFIKQCTSSDRSLRSMLTQESVSAAACSQEEQPSLLAETDLDTHLLISNELLVAGLIDTLNTVQDAEIARRNVEDAYAAPNFEMLQLEELPVPERVHLENNLLEESSVNSSIESVPQMSVESLDMQLLLSSSLHMSSTFDFTYKNAPEIDGIGDNLKTICAIVALSNEAIPSGNNRSIKAEPAEPSSDALNVQGQSKTRQSPKCTMPKLEIQSCRMETINAEDNVSTQIKDSNILVAEIKEEHLELQRTTIRIASTVNTPEPTANGTTPSNQMLSDSAGVKFKCPCCPTECKNQSSLVCHTKLHKKQKTIPVTRKPRKQLFKEQDACKGQDNLAAIMHHADVQNNSMVEKHTSPSEVGSPVVHHTSLLKPRQSPISLQLNQLKRVLIVKLTRLPENSLPVTEHVTSPKTQKTKKKFKCAICFKEYAGKWFLAAHIKDHEARAHPEERPFKCKQCEKTYKNIPALNAHIRRHSAKRIYECEQCKRSFVRMIHLKRHMLVHSNVRPFKCETCGKGFREAYSLSSHLLSHSTEKPFKCGKCYRAFKRERNLKQHERLHGQPQNKLWHRCVLCLSDFLTEQRLEDHLQTHKDKNIQPGLTNERFQPHPSSASIEAEEQIQKSLQPSKTITQAKRDQTKVKNNSQQPTARAKEECLVESYELQQTVRDSKMFKCNVCFMVFDIRMWFDRHRKALTHYKCNICDKMFGSSKSWRAHKVVHKVSRPAYPCDICCKTFTQRGSVNRHKLLHAAGEKPFKCSYCQQGYVTKTALGIHERTHFENRPFKCNLCDRSYRESYNLILHMRIHNKERNFKCIHCKATFHRQGYLYRHLKVHETNRKMYTCDNCRKSYLRRRSIIGHLKKFHTGTKS